jgi:hypothetical protein
LVKLEKVPCETSGFEFYDLSVRSPSNPIGLDVTTANLLTNGQPVGLTSAQLAAFLTLQDALQAQLSSEPACPGDGNKDKTVNADDLSGIVRYFGQPSVFDFNQDGVTDHLDVAAVTSNFGKVCR